MRKFNWNEIFNSMLPEQLWVKHEDALAAIEQARREWKYAVENELATMESTCANYPTPRDAIRALIDWHVFVALNPLVSKRAKALIEHGRREEREACAQIAWDLAATDEPAEKVTRAILARGEGK